MTSSLFATTVLASFFVVALPHILPCPAPRRAYADDGDTTTGGANADPNAVRRVRRRRRVVVEEESEAGDGEVGVVEFQPGTSKTTTGDGVGAGVKGKRERECPVPKPGGILGEWLGFNAAPVPAPAPGPGAGIGVGAVGKEGGERGRPER
jgi:cytochrome c oxidase assembly factor 2